MNYAVVKAVNGHFFIASEHGDNLSAAKNAFWDQCKALNNASDVVTGMVTVVDENLNTVENKKEFIEHPVVDE